MKRYFPAFAIIAALSVVSMSCRSDVTDPADANAEAGASSVAATDGVTGGEMMRDVDLGDAKAVFVLAWHPRPVDRGSDETKLMGHSGAIGFEETPTEPPYIAAGIDMGDVTLQTPDGDVALNERSSRNGGVAYSTRTPRSQGESVNIGFEASATYTFQVGGSDAFAAVSVAVQAPPALLDISSPEQQDVVSGDEALTVTWEGGYEGAVRIAVSALPERKVEGERHGNGRCGGRGGRPGGPRGHHQRPEPGFQETIDSNTGSFTIPAEVLAELIAGTENATRLFVHIGQTDVLDVDDNGETLKTIVRNGDRVMLLIASAAE